MIDALSILDKLIMKDFLYLVQGRSDLVQDYLHLSERQNADAIFLTYDKKITDAIFFPNSTWAQGRNKLLEEAQKLGSYQYYIFCDDDIEFKKGGWSKLEENLLSLVPAIAIPVFLEKTKNSPLRWLKYHSFLFNDEQIIAFHKDVLRDGIVLPYQTQFDNIHWWASCQIQQILIQNFYSSASIQLNDIQIANKIHNRYPLSKKNRLKFQKLVRDWFSVQFATDYKDIKMSIRKNFHIIIWRTIIYFLCHHLHKQVPRYSVREADIRKKLFFDSEILKRYEHYLSSRYED